MSAVKPFTSPRIAECPTPAKVVSPQVGFQTERYRSIAGSTN
jgi:hypothetical protein